MLFMKSYIWLFYDKSNSMFFFFNWDLFEPWKVAIKTKIQH